MCRFVILYVFVLFFKQKTAYEMRISDWSSDVCSSDLDRRRIDDVLLGFGHFFDPAGNGGVAGRAFDERAASLFDVLGGEPAAVCGPVGLVRHHTLGEEAGKRLGHVELADAAERARPEAGAEQMTEREIGRASGRERVWQ